VEPPEFPLSIRRKGSCSGHPGKFVVWEGKILENEFDFFRILVQHLLE
jgi:hypothetical protein